MWYYICSAWFLDIIISTCFVCHFISIGLSYWLCHDFQFRIVSFNLRPVYQQQQFRNSFEWVIFWNYSPTSRHFSDGKQAVPLGQLGHTSSHSGCGSD